MKLPLIFIALGLFASCSNPSKEIKVVQTDLKGKYSEIELKDFNYQSTELSDREAYRFIYALYMKDVDKYRAFPDAVQVQLDKAKRFQDLQALAKGDSIFHKVTYVKLEQDTISSGVYILNVKDSIVYRRMFK